MAPLPPPKKKITISLTVFTALYISSLRLIYFVSRNLYLLISLPHFTPPQPASPLATMFVLCMCVFLFCYVGSFVFQIPCLSEIIWYVSLFFSSSLTSSFLPSLFSSSYLLHGYQHLLSWAAILGHNIFVLNLCQCCFFVFWITFLGK